MYPDIEKINKREKMVLFQLEHMKKERDSLKVTIEKLNVEKQVLQSLRNLWGEENRKQQD